MIRAYKLDLFANKSKQEKIIKSDEIIKTYQLDKAEKTIKQDKISPTIKADILDI